jgi:hypothetical protein
MFKTFSKTKIRAFGHQTLGVRLRIHSMSPRVACLYIPTDASIPCPRTKKDDVVLGYERGYALYKSLSGRKKFNGSTEMFRPTVGFCIQGDLGTTR